MAIVLASVIGLAAIAAIAISVLLNHHHDNDTKRSVTLPVTILGHDLQPIDPNIGDDTSELLAGTFPAHGPWLTPIGATYGPVGASEFFVGAAQLTRSLTATQIRAFELPRMTPLSVVTKGPFGGTVKCTSSANDSGAACVSIDSSAIVIIVTIGQSESTTLSITLGAVRAIER